MSTSIPAPGGNIVRRQLQFFWLTDHSGSMFGTRIATLNQAIRAAIPEVQRAVSAHPEVQIMMRAIKFASSAKWHPGPTSVPLESYAWNDLDVEGSTATHDAISLLAGELDIRKMPERGFPPVCILISDGCCDDSNEFRRAVNKLVSLPWGKRAVRLAIGIGDSDGSDYDESELLEFVSHREVGVLKADSPEKLTAYIKWASVAASVGSSINQSKQAAAATQNVVLPTSPPIVQTTSSTDLF